MLVAYLDNDGNVQSAQTVSQPGLKSGLTLELYIGAAGIYSNKNQFTDCIKII